MRPRSTTRRAVAITIAGAGFAAMSLAAHAAKTPDPRFFPAPGLYRIQTLVDTAAHSPAGQAKARTVTDAATGAAETQYRRIDGATGAYATPGAGPDQVCIGPVSTTALPPSLQIDGCKAGKGAVVGDSMVSSSICPWGKVESRIRQIDGKTWETITRTAITGAASVADSAGGLLAMRKMAEKMAKEGTPEQRAEAREFLAASTGLEGELQRHQGAAPAKAPSGAAGASLQEYRNVQRMTRIGDCKG